MLHEEIYEGCHMEDQKVGGKEVGRQAGGWAGGGGVGKGEGEVGWL